MLIGDAMNELARSRVLVGDDWDARGIPDAANWGDSDKVPAMNLVGADLPIDHTIFTTGCISMPPACVGWGGACSVIIPNQFTNRRITTNNVLPACDPPPPHTHT